MQKSPRRYPLRRLRLAAMTVLVASFAAPVFADDDECEVPMANWQPRAAIMQLAQEKGWVVRRIKIEEGCYAVYAREPDGRPVEIHLNPSTLEVLRIERESKEDHGKAHDQNDQD